MTFWGTTEHFRGECKCSINVSGAFKWGKKHNVKSLRLEFLAFWCYF